MDGCADRRRLGLPRPLQAIVGAVIRIELLSGPQAFDLVIVAVLLAVRYLTLAIA